MIEFLIALFLLSGIVKSAIYGLSLNFGLDITLLSALFLLFYVIKEFFFLLKSREINVSKKDLIAIVTFSVFVVWMLITSIFDFSDYPNYTKFPQNFGFKKIGLFGMCVFSFFVIFILRRKINFKTFANYYINIVIILGIFFILFIPPVYFTDEAKSTLEKIVFTPASPSILLYFFPELETIINHSNFISIPLPLAQFIGASLLMFPFVKKINYLNLFWFVFLVFILFATAARGPLVFFVLTSFSFLLFKILVHLKSNKFDVFLSKIKSKLLTFKSYKNKVYFVLGTVLFFIASIAFSQIIRSYFDHTFMRFAFGKNYLTQYEKIAYEKQKADSIKTAKFIELTMLSENDEEIEELKNELINGTVTSEKIQKLNKKVFSKKRRKQNSNKQDESNFIKDSIRIEQLFSDIKNINSNTPKIDKSFNYRVVYFKESIRLIKNDFKHFFIGYGIGTFSKLCKESLYLEDYPHNIILEIWLEIGLIGLLLFVYLVFLSFTQVRKEGLFFLLVTVYWLLNLMKSNTLVDRNLFAFLAVLLAFFQSEPLKIYKIKNLFNVIKNKK